MSDRRRNRAVDYALYVALRLFAMFVQIANLEAQYRAVGRICDAMWWLGRWIRPLGTFRQRCMAHLRRSFPDTHEAQLERLARASMRSFFYLALEVLLTPRLMNPCRWRRYARLEGPETEQALRIMCLRDGPVIFVTGHYGNWEMLGYTTAALGFESVAVARPLDNPYISEYIYGLRQARGLRIIDKKGASAEADHILSTNQVLSFIADQDAGRKGVFVDFFGRKASTYKSIALLAIRYGAPIIVGYARRVGETYFFSMGAQRVIHPAEWAGRDDPVYWITQEYTAALEQVVRDAPEQYLWTHRRWKHRPKGEPQPADGIA